MADLVADLTKAKPPTAKMQAGAALAKALEYAPFDQPLETFYVDGWAFSLGELDAEMPAMMFRELKVRQRVSTSTGPVLLTGKVDGIDALTVADQKLSDRYDPERYLDSIQWRAYLWLTGARKFRYDVFEGRINEDEKIVKVFGYHPVVFYAYPGMERDVMDAVEELASVVRRYSIFPEEAGEEERPRVEARPSGTERGGERCEP